MGLTGKLSVLVVLTALSALLCGCTTWAEVHGPQVAAGFEYDWQHGVSPRFELGYQYMRYNGVLGYGGTTGVTAAPFNGRVELFVDGRASTFLTISALAPMVIGGALAITPNGLSPGLRAGLSGLLFYPPEACTVGLEGDQPPLEQKCAGQFTSEDEVHPNWLPRIDVLFGWYPTFSDPDLGGYDVVEEPFVLSATFGATLADYWVVGGLP